MTVNISAFAGAGIQFFDNNGNVLSGGKLHSYQAGTTTPQTTYTSFTGAVAHTNPIILNSAGRVATGEIWVTAGLSYKFVLTDSNDVTIATWDNVTGINGTGIATNAVNVQYDPAGTGAVTRTGQDKFREFVSRSDYDSQANYETARVNKFSIDASNRTWQPYAVAGSKPFGNTGDTFPSSSALRDGFTVSRDLLGLTDCHAFSDKTVIDQVTDYGGYGSFDATLILRGNNTQNHVYSFQDRLDYQGSGTLQTYAGLYSNPVFSGSGTIENRYGVVIYNINKTGSGTINGQIGVYIPHLSSATANVAINVEQQAGSGSYVLYAAGGAPSYHLGAFGVGTVASSGVKLHVNGGSGAADVGLFLAKTGGFSYYAPSTGKFWQAGVASFGPVDNTGSGVALTARGASTGPHAFLHSTTTNVQTGGIGGDYPYQIITNGAVRLEITASADAYTLRPGADDAQYLGDLSKRWKAVYAVNGTIQTSDARQKQDVAPLDEIEKRVAVRLKGLIKKFKFKASVEKKGARARIHVGVIAQEVAEAFAAEGLDANEYGIFCYDSWPVEYDNDGNVTRAAGDGYGIRYDELLAFVIAAI